MEYYHLHTKGNKDYLWKEHSEFVVDQKWNNRIYKRCANFTTSVKSSNYPELTEIINYLLCIGGYSQIEDLVNIKDLLNVCISHGTDKKTLKRLLKDSLVAMNNANIFKREMALEAYRKDNTPTLPSRMHSLYVTTKDGVDYWQSLLIDGDLDVYKLDIAEEPFIGNEQLLPSEELSYQDTYKQAAKYWHPKLKKVNPLYNEYLVQGRVRVLKKVLEIKR